MQRMHDKTMGLQLTVQPLNSHGVGGHAYLSEYVLSSPGEVSSIKNYLIIFKTKFKFLASGGHLFFRQVDVIEVIHTIIHGVFRSHFPERILIFHIELLGKGLVSLVLKEPISSAHGSFHHDVAHSDIAVTGAHTAVLISHFPLWHFNPLFPVYGVRSESLNTISLQELY